MDGPLRALCQAPEHTSCFFSALISPFLSLFWQVVFYVFPFTKVNLWRPWKMTERKARTKRQKRWKFRMWRVRKRPRRTESSASMEPNGGSGGMEMDQWKHDVMISEVQPCGRIGATWMWHTHKHTQESKKLVSVSSDSSGCYINQLLLSLLTSLHFNTEMYLHLHYSLKH